MFSPFPLIHVVLAFSGESNDQCMYQYVCK